MREPNQECLARHSQSVTTKFKRTCAAECYTRLKIQWRPPTLPSPSPCEGVTPPHSIHQPNLPVCLLIFYPVFGMSRKNFESSIIELTQSIGMIVRRIRVAAASHELSLTEAAVMARLDRDGPATTADLARAERIKPQSMGAAIAALEELGMVERKPHPTDGRQFHIALTAKGLAVRNSTKDAKRTWLAQAVTQLNDEERETLFKAGAILKRLAEN
jgi:DNA-binding MarR family transcriptional regulator